MAVKSYTFADADKGINLQLPGDKVFWTTGRNVRFTPGFVSQSKGKSLQATTAGAQPIRAMFSYINPYGHAVTIVCSDTTVYAYNEDFSGKVTEAAALDITPSPAPSGDTDSVWSFALVGGLLFVSNGEDQIWEWLDSGGTYGVLSDVGTGVAAKFIGSCMHRLILANVTTGGTTYPGRIMWSEAGNPENFTIDLQLGAGMFDLVDYQTGAEAIVSIKGMQIIDNKAFIFGEKGLWACDFSQQIKQFVIVDPAVELLGPKCVCHVGHMLYFLGKTDVHKTIIGKAEDIGLPIRKDLFDGLNQTYAHRSFVFAPHGTNEVWFCIPTGSNTDPDTAYVYNYELDNWTMQDVDSLCHSTSYDDL